MALPSNWYLLGAKTYPARARASAPPAETVDPGELTPPPAETGFDYSGTVWFRRSVSWNGGGVGTRPLLDLDMVDYDAEVFVNGTLVGHHEGYFQAWSVDLSPAWKPGANLIALKVSAPSLVVDLAQEFPVSWPKQQDQVKGIFGYHDTRPGATTARGQERGTGGILRGIALRASTGVDLLAVKVTPTDVSAASARLLIEAVTNNWGSATVDATLSGVIRPKNFSDGAALPVSIAFKATPGRATARAEVTIDHPALWWCWDRGKPNLYQLEAKLTATGGAPLDTRAVTFGVRSIARDDQWVVRLNGQRVYFRGTNYIATQWLSQATRAFYAHDLELMLRANLNAVRVHAHLERPEFYELADELGLLIWQDFPLQWGYTDQPAFQRQAIRQAGDMLERFYDHPSIIVWCMHNESPHAMEWMKKRDPHQNQALDDALLAVARAGDPARIAHRDSGTGDGHSYFGWYEGRIGDIVRTPPAESVVTEYGGQALPVLETLHSMFDGDALSPDSARGREAWRFADFQAKETFAIAHVKRGANLAAFVAASQLYQANLIKFQTEFLRRRKWAGSTGLYQFMFVDDWPSITWSVVDYHRRPKRGYAALRDAMQPVLPSIAYDIHNGAGAIALWVVNDGAQALTNAQLKWTVSSASSGRVLNHGQRTITVAADSATKILDLGALPRVAAGSARLQVSIENERGDVLGRNQLAGENFVIDR
jgi:beta-mannosidase